MKQSKIISIYNATEKLADKNYSTQEQWKIYQLRKSLRTHIEFQEEREKLLTDKYTPYADKEGVLRGEKYVEYLKEKEGLDNMDVEFNVEKITLPLVDGVNFKIIEDLEDVIEFTT